MRRRGSRSADAWSIASPKRPDSQVAAALLTGWPHGKPPTRSQLDVILRREGLSPTWWSNGPGDHYAAHSHSYHKVLFCAEGSIIFHIEPEDADHELRPGDRLDIPRGTPHSAIVGPSGVTCVEAQAN
jgi:mannose-6-phosphate isomerase-like protein (cupin superfamily)